MSEDASRRNEARSIRSATFRAVGATHALPVWMAQTDVGIAPHSFPRHGRASEPAREIAPPEPDEGSTSGEHPVVSAPPPRIASIVPPPPPPAEPTPDPVLVEAARAFLSARDRALAEAQDELIAMALEIARAVLDIEIDARPELHRRLVTAALEVLGPGTTPRVRVAPEAFDSMVAGLGGRTFEVDGRRLELEIDASLSGNGVVLEAGEARVDGSIEARLSQARVAMARARHGAASEAA